MSSKISQPWIQMERIEALVQLEPALVIVSLALGSWLIYKVFLAAISEERHKNLGKLFLNLAVHMALGIIFFIAYWGIRHVFGPSANWERIASYFGLFATVSGAIAFVKIWRILFFEYLFLGHMRVGVPLLLVNIFTLLLSVFLVGWLLSEIFGIKLGPLLATSAIFSLVLGLALQDTLGNLFSGIALQLDKPYSIGDWVEVQNGGQKWIGQIQEITWRATILVAFTDEIMTIPNRIMGQSEISNFSTRTRPIIRSQVFRIPYGSSIKRAKEILIQTATAVPEVRRNPVPIAIVTEAADSWVTLKLVYYIDDYGLQFLIGDQILSRGIEALAKVDIPTASQRLQISRIS